MKKICSILFALSYISMKSLTCKEYIKKSLKNKDQKTQDREIRKQYKNPIDKIIQYMKNYALSN